MAALVAVDFFGKRLGEADSISLHDLAGDRREKTGLPYRTPECLFLRPAPLLVAEAVSRYNYLGQKDSLGTCVLAWPDWCLDGL
jgi:hypothetical protein